jgi:bile acid:Na+ symporter, BASS family
MKLNDLMIALILCVMMFNLGLSLRREDFTRVIQNRSLVAVVLMLQIVLLPLLAYVVGTAFNLSGGLLLGLLLIALVPGGITAGAFSIYLGGNAALNISLTALNTITSVFTLPIALTFISSTDLVPGVVITAVLSKAGSTMVLILLPLLLGMWIKKSKPVLANKSSGPISKLSLVCLVGLVLGSIWVERDRVVSHSAILLMPLIAMFSLSALLGVAVARWFNASRENAISSALEFCVHNTGLAIFMALGIWNSTVAAVPAALYTVITYATLLALIFFIKVNGRARKIQSSS